MRRGEVDSEEVAGNRGRTKFQPQSRFFDGDMSTNDSVIILATVSPVIAGSIRRLPDLTGRKFQCALNHVAWRWQT